jgi:hypothetical protein
MNLTFEKDMNFTFEKDMNFRLIQTTLIYNKRIK